MAAFVLAMGLVAFAARSGVSVGAGDVPPGLDPFLARVGSVLPTSARLFVAGRPPALLLYRAVYDLYPHVVTSALPTDFAHEGAPSPTLNWPVLVSGARRAGARYVLLWSYDLAPHGAVRLRVGSGVLAEVACAPRACR